MTDRSVKNVAASIRQRLTNQAKASDRPFQEVLQYFAMERFLSRLSLSPHAERFILKGALMFNVWGAPASRPTRDIDFLGRINNDISSIAAVFREICQKQGGEPDGLVFAADTVVGHSIKEDADYVGVRVTFQAFLENARVPMQIDIGFGDTVVPEAAIMDYPTILKHAPPRLWAYPKETVVAEKFEAMVKLGELNSRLKDFFDLWLLSRQFEFDGRLLCEAITQTFQNRRTAINPRPIALTETFANNSTKKTQWKGFLRKSRLHLAPQQLPEVVELIAQFLLPPAQAMTAGQTFSQKWQPAGTWSGE
ncbi:nucleotidyl transferase AbiEii/AbiGii toxin family protein [Planctomicrobium piriforme]|uniref:Nucleotidyl transferase AbiEii toxin, Type IV TA system n=1 Tax=Planctomicrobium piriforme TaxID=1576369 RepID=A0A1I3LDE4_9PLAN|nr:nucleotidyl transferase AbiEii/AbiGii toxin family protein [Planctomicrobium piriforme]SFI82832.1 Nucleotidyl transferase AbiEii toxin, Type IV TA system [Planctomicrobium piriforme]